MGRGNHEIVVLVREGGEALGEVALVMVVNVRQAADRVRRIPARDPGLLDRSAQHVPDRLGAVAVSLVVHELVELSCEPVRK